LSILAKRGRPPPLFSNFLDFPFMFFGGRAQRFRRLTPRPRIPGKFSSTGETSWPEASREKTRKHVFRFFGPTRLKKLWAETMTSKTWLGKVRGEKSSKGTMGEKTLGKQPGKREKKNGEGGGGGEFAKVRGNEDEFRADKRKGTVFFNRKKHNTKKKRFESS